MCFHSTIRTLLACLLLSLPLMPQAQSKRPKIGVTLSGGGARGLAHIGILKAMDSAGLKPDYITGTSMGSIVGGLYAVGYSGKEIEAIADGIDWNQLLSNESPLTGIIMEEKNEYKRYAVELPLEEGKFKLPTGFLESEELWLTLSELFFPVYGIKSFDQFSIPFRCIATDATTGEPVVLKNGEITSAVRASMAIPSFFTAVDIDGRRLVDGGIVRNFPVSDVREMGADIVIGVNVSTGLNTKEKLTSPVSVLSNVMFFMEAQNTRSQIDQCNIYIPVHADEFSAASFGKSRAIIDSGIAIGNALYPRFKFLADSLDNIYGARSPRPGRLPAVDSILVSSIEVNGLKQTDQAFFVDMMGFKKGKYYTPDEISRRIRKGFGIRYYSRITYRLEKSGDNSARMIFQVEENPLSAAKLSLHFNSFSGISIVGNFTSRNLFSKSSRSFVTANIGENLRLRAEHMEYLGKRRNLSLTAQLQYEFLDIPQYADFTPYGESRQYFFKLGTEIGYSYNRSQMLGLGFRYEQLRFNPSLISLFAVKGKSNLFAGSMFYRLNTLNRNVYPTKGWKLDIQGDWITSQNGSLTFFIEGKPILDTDSLNLSQDPYGRTMLLAETYQRLSSRGTLLAVAQAGINFRYGQFFVNDFMVGGMTRQFRNQVVFAGYSENEIFSNSVASVQLGYQHEIFDKLYLVWRSNIMAYEFVARKDAQAAGRFLSGHALTASYLTAIGPIEFSAMYGDQSRKLQAYVNIGLSF